MGMFGDTAPPRPRDAADELVEAARKMDHETAFKLLESAGGSCQTRDLAKLAAERDDSISWTLKGSKVTGLETVSVIRHTSYLAPYDVASVEQLRCERD